MTSPAELKHVLLQDKPLVNNAVLLQFPGVVYALRSNSKSLLANIAQYFKVRVVEDLMRADFSESITNEPIEIIAIESDSVSLPYQFTDWQREPGKTGKKDAVCDFERARLIHKVRTGMMFLQSQEYRIAAGECLKNDNQVVNFIINQYMNLLQQQGWLICHAAALAENNHATALSGFSGGGKSTAMLHLMAESQFDFVSNDRLFIRFSNNGIEVRGVPKMPRINPGTIVNNTQLRPMLSQAEIEEFENLPVGELWNLEQKYDVDVATVYGASRFCDHAKLKNFVILNWSRSDLTETQFKCVNIREERGLLAAIMKSSGPFYQYTNGNFYQDNELLDEQAYINVLDRANIIQVTGSVNFERLKAYCLSL